MATRSLHRRGSDESHVRSVTPFPSRVFLNPTFFRTDTFQLIGHSRAVANLSIGQLTLDPINFNVTSSLNGLRGLRGDTTISGVDVLGGTTDAIQLAINGSYFCAMRCGCHFTRSLVVSIFNPSNLNLNIGDLCEYFPSLRKRGF